ncbi:VRR-NUC domain-containing protein [Elsinoe fawcettii]|nr:VRR-NUC domain-containing protein [Elsinoe fawcettii]
MLADRSPSKHNAMVGTKISHPPSTNFSGSEDFEKRPIKRIKRSPPDDDIPLSSPIKHDAHNDLSSAVPDDIDPDTDTDSQAPIAPDKPTDLETALPPIRTDKEAIRAYETSRFTDLASSPDDASSRLSARKWVRGKSSIYVDAFNLALDTVLEDESHLFDAAETRVFDDWKALSYEAQYLYVRLFLRKTASWHRVGRLGYYSDIADMETAIEELQRTRELPETRNEGHEAPGEWEPPAEGVEGEGYTFADRSEECITTLEEASSLLLLDELKAIAKDAKVQGKNKTELLRALRRTSGKQTGLGFLKRSDTEESVESRGDSDSGASTPRENRDAHFVGKIMAETGPCIRLSLPVLKLFERVHLVFYRSTEWTEKSLTTIILARISRWNFPSYLVSRSANIFPSRAILLEFEASVRTQFRVDNILEFNGTPTKDTLETVLDIFEEVLPRWQVLLADEQRKEDSIYATGEGAYLRRLSPAWVYTRIVHKGAFVLGKFKQHLREHEILSLLLGQKLFHTSRRGDWYQRKALLEEHYMHALHAPEGRDADAQKKHWKRIALLTCETGLQDPLTHLIFHHDLQKRITKLEKSLKVPKRMQHEFSHVRLAKAAETTFYGVQIVRADGRRKSDPVVAEGASGNRKGAKTLWLDPALPEDVARQRTPVSVEHMCLSHYRKQGWRGYHCESALLRTLFGAIMYDIMFAYVPNVFQTEFQTCPLDLHTDSFYPTRIREVEERLREVGNGRAGEVVGRFYEEHREKRTCVVGVHWDFDEGEVRRIAGCWDPEALSTVLKVLAQEYGSRGGGVPDLFLWREFDPVTLRSVRGAEEGGVKDEGVRKSEGDDIKIEGASDKEEEILDEFEKKRRRALLDKGQAGEVMFAEVKSENDRLSDTQRMWIDVLTGAGIRVELTHALASEVRTEEL